MTYSHRSVAPALITLLIGLPLVPRAVAAPDRESFGREARPVEGVPVEAFQLPDGFQIDVWAQSPMIFSPVAMDCDSSGRLWVTEGIDYNAGRRIDAGRSIMVVEDTDGDGRADASHVFVTERNIRHAPLGIAVFDNRIVLSATPSIIVYTDVDRNAVFDPAVDTREVFLTGFQNPPHDHTLHAVVGAPSGQWHFSYGNCGADLRTKDGRHFLSGCYYGYPEAIGKPSSDGHVYVGGVTMRINPDGTGLTPTAQNMRNPHDMAVTAYGDILQSDNDDPAHARSSWVMEYGNMGYADLRDGSRSWEEVAKTWEEPSGWHQDLRYSRSHWRENYPGACPPGSVYGAGSPTGNVFVEDDTLGLAGTYLVACMVRKEVMACTPKPQGAAIDMGRHKPFVSLKEGEKGRFFLPTDLVVGTDGSLFLGDFYNDTSRVTNQVSGTIYRITRTGAPALARPAVDFSTVPGQLAALKSPAINVRSHAAALLIAGGELAVTPTTVALETEPSNPVHVARHLWVLAPLGEAGRAAVTPFLHHENPQLQITAYRALRQADPTGVLARAKDLADSPSPMVRREVALSLRDTPYRDCAEILGPLFAGYDGHDRYYLEALGVAVTGKESPAYRDLVAAKFGDPAGWTKTAKNLAWRLHTPEAIAALDACLRAQVPPVDEFRHLAMAFASFRSDADRRDRRARLEALASLPAFARADYQLTVTEIIEKDLNDLQGEAVTTTLRVPEALGEKTEVSAPEVIAALPGDARRGAELAVKCFICHKLSGNGVAFGPELTHWGRERTLTQIIEEIVHPDARFAHGYDRPVRLTAGAHVMEGLMTNYSWHAGSLKIKLMGGGVKKIDFRSTGAGVEELKTSLMPSASEMGLLDQDVRDIAEYLQSSGGVPVPVRAAGDEDATPPDGTTTGWQVLTGEDFVNVNCHDDTWRWEGGHAFCTGTPTGVIRYREPLVNFELLCSWMHKQKGGNSGVFVWATPESIASLSRGRGSLPHGIEVQVLDLGYAEIYTKEYNKPADWFTSHGDVFPVGPIAMRPFPPVAPDGRRSFPSKETTRGINEWNHYYIRAVDGEVKLWVNGEMVSGGDGISPAFGFLCLESEGAPVEFQNIRLRRLPSAEDPEITLDSLLPPPLKPVSLEGHPLLGTWHYGNHSREITADGYCTLRQGDTVVWKRRCLAKTDTSLTLEGDLVHKLEGDVLHIEGQYQARRR
jgi:putative membrane-bound dehydrogenase-like protein